MTDIIQSQSNNVAQSQQKSTIVFNPTNAMLKWFDTSIDLGYGASITDVSKTAKLDRTNWYIWLKIPGFVDWWEQQWKLYFDTNRWKLKAIGMKQAERNYDYWHDMMTASGQLVDEDQNTINNDIKILVTRG